MLRDGVISLMARHQAGWALAALLAGACLPAAGDPADRARELYEQADSALAERRFAQAEEALRASVALDSTYYEARVALARLYVGRRLSGQAAEQLEAAMRLRPGDREAPFEYARLRTQQGRPQEAYAVLVRLAQAHPDFAPARLGIGFLCMEPTGMMDLEAAGRAFESVLQQDPGDQVAAFNLGQVRFRQGAWGEAGSAFTALIERHPEHFGAHYQLGYLRYLQEDYAAAALHLRRAVELSPRSLSARWGLRLAFEALGGYPADLPGEQRLGLASDDSAAVTGVRFTEVAGQAGVDRLDLGRGSAWADYDGDGDLDLFTTGEPRGNALYRNEGGRFTDRTEKAGLVGPAGFACLFADYDNDGAPDLFITRNGWHGPGPNTLYRNEGNGTFLDVTQAAGVADSGSSLGASWGDVNGDGRLDLFVANGIAGDGSASRLYLGRKDGRFRDVAAAAGIRVDRCTGGAFGDYDNDGDLDLYVATYGTSGTLYRNDTPRGAAEAVFVDVTRRAGTQYPPFGYFPFFLDYDNDGDLDLFCAEMSDYETALYSLVTGHARRDKNRPALYRNEGDGTFADMTYQAGLGRSYGTGGAHCGDVDSDGYPDIYLATGGPEVARLQPHALLLNQRDGTFVDIAPAAGLSQLRKGHGVTFADYDGDGDQDIYVPTGGAYPGDQSRNLLYRNDGDVGNHLTLRLVGVRSNRDAVGARVRVRTAAGTTFAEVSNGGGVGRDQQPPARAGPGVGAGGGGAGDPLARRPGGRVPGPGGEPDAHRRGGRGPAVRAVGVLLGAVVVAGPCAVVTVGAGAVGAPHAHVRQAALLLKARQAEAARELQEALRLDPQCAEAYFDLGLVRQHQARHSQAAAMYRACLERDPAHRQAYHRLGQSYLQLERDADARIMLAGFADTPEPRSEENAVFAAPGAR